MTTALTTTGLEVDATPDDAWRTNEFLDWLYTNEATADADEDTILAICDSWVLSRSRLRTPLGLPRTERSLTAVDVDFLLGEDALAMADEEAVDISLFLRLTSRGWAYYLMFLADIGDPVPDLKEHLLTFLRTELDEEQRTGPVARAHRLVLHDPRQQVEDLDALPFVRSAAVILDALKAGPLEGTAFEGGMVRQALFATHLVETSNSLVRPGRRMRDWRSGNADKAAAARRSLIVWWVCTLGRDLSDQEPDQVAEVVAELITTLQGKPSTAEPGSLTAGLLSHLGVVPGGVMPVGVRPAVQVGLSRLHDAGIAVVGG